MEPPIISISIDTEEDNWGWFGWDAASVRNIQELPRVQEVFDRYRARPTYLVNHAPLANAESVRVLRDLAQRDDVEIGAHCHPWNTPPRTVEGEANSMMFRFDLETNRAKIAAVKQRLESELGVTPVSFRAGRWGLGPTVAEAIVQLGIRVDCSVTPGVDWTGYGGPDYAGAPLAPYRFVPQAPLSPAAEGALIELSPTIGFLRGHHRLAGRVRSRLEKSRLARIGVVGAFDRLQLLARRWLSPEQSSVREMIRLSDSWISSSDGGYLHMTFHSSALLPGATPFVRDDSDRRRFLDSIDAVLAHLQRRGGRFATLDEAARTLFSP